MKTRDYIIAIVLIVGAFVAGFSIKETCLDRSKNFEKLFRGKQMTKEVLLDSVLMRIQAAFLEEDSVASVYMLNQLELRPKIGYLILENLRRHQILDEQSYASAKRRMETYEFIDCCL
ncbi:MAG: hypothetical protein GY816_02785 [Cytophagales bacterium]|nr:hypothetical protein [Cytophagales bacterium]